jgi:tetratricopeptide (TPR) repeat protein
MRAAPVALLVATLACAHAPHRGDDFVCPARGGPGWTELTTPHFTVASDLRPAQAERIATELEGIRAWVIAALFPGEARDVPGRVRVVALRSTGELDIFAPPGLRAYFTRDGLGQAVVVMTREMGAEVRLVLAHELAHHALRHVYPRQPRWFGEGLAGLAEALAAGPSATAFGRIPAHRARGFERRHVTVRALLAWNGDTRDSRYHDTATVLVHYLLHEEPRRFADVKRRLARAEAPDEVWREVFPEWAPERPGGPEALDRALVAHVAARPDDEREIPFEHGAKPAARPMAPGEVHAVRLTLPRFARGDPPAGALAERAEMEEALQEDPDHVVGLQVRAALDGVDPLPLARRAVGAHPGDVRAWLWLAAAARDTGAEAERLEALERAVAVAPGSAMAANNLAWNLTMRGETARALPLAERAARLAPGDPAVLDTLSAVLEASGRCVEALETADRALELLPEGTSEAARALWTQRRTRLRAQCPARP